MDREKLLELAERAEKASGPDRALDGLIEVARDPNREVLLYNEPGPFPQKAVYGPVHKLVLTGRDLADYIGAPSYTASLDAAMTLVPEGWSTRLITHPGENHAEVYLLGDVTEVQGGLERDVLGHGEVERAATPALALCAAALRARASKEGPSA